MSAWKDMANTHACPLSSTTGILIGAGIVDWIFSGMLQGPCCYLPWIICSPLPEGSDFLEKAAQDIDLFQCSNTTIMSVPPK